MLLVVSCLTIAYDPWAIMKYIDWRYLYLFDVNLDLLLFADYILPDDNSWYIFLYKAAIKKGASFWYTDTCLHTAIIIDYCW